jgi:hypothetical protein
VERRVGKELQRRIIMLERFGRAGADQRLIAEHLLFIGLRPDVGPQLGCSGAFFGREDGQRNAEENRHER